MSIHGNKPLYSDMFSYSNYWLYSFIITWVQISLTIHFENVIRIILKLLSLIIIGSNRFHSSWDCPSLCWRKIFVRSVKLDYSIRWVSKLEWLSRRQKPFLQRCIWNSVRNNPDILIVPQDSAVCLEFCFKSSWLLLLKLWIQMELLSSVQNDLIILLWV